MSDTYDNDDILQQFGAQKSDCVTINAENINILNTVDTLDASAALKLHRGFSMKDLDIEVEKAHKYVDSVKKACVAANLSIPFVEQTVEIEKMNITMLCKSMIYASHAVDMLFMKIVDMGPAAEFDHFHSLVHLQNDASRLLANYMQYVRQLPMVFNAYNRTAENADIIESELSGADKQQNALPQSESIVTRTITDLIDISDDFADQFKTADFDYNDKDAVLTSKFKQSKEAAERYGIEEVYQDEATYTEILAKQCEEFDIEAERKLQAKADVKN